MAFKVLEYLLYGIPLYLFGIAPLLRSFDINLPTFGSQSPRDPSVPITYEKTSALVSPDPNLDCPHHAFGVHILQNDPLVIYLRDFLTVEETGHIKNSSIASYAPSTIHRGDDESLDPSVRDSYKAMLPRDHAVQCIEARALAFQGWPEYTYIERLWAQKYEAGGHYSHHFDWGSAPGRTGGGRVTSFMVYLQGEEEGLKGGGTEFPRLKRPDGKWCDVVECLNLESREEEEGEEGMGATFKAIGGNAVFWENFDKDGEGYGETWHAGLPVMEGTKIGLNIWSWRQPGLRIIQDEEANEAAEART